MNFFTNSCTAFVGGVEIFNARFLNALKALFFSFMILLWGGSYAKAQSDSTASASVSSELRSNDDSGDSNNDGDDNDGDDSDDGDDDAHNDDDDDDDDNGENTVAICHQLGNGGSITIYVNPSAVEAHLNHGDALGVCDGGQNNDVPCELSLSVGCPADVTVECGEEGDLEYTGVPEISGEFCLEHVNVNFEDALISCTPCGKVISRTWIISVGNLVEVCTQIITSQDTQGPAIIGLDSEITVQCLEERPGFQAVTAVDACSGETSIENWQSNTGERESECVATTAFGPGADWAVWLPTLSSASGANFVFDANGGHFDQFADGTAHFYGTVVNTMNANEQFIVDLWFENKADWAAWAGQGRNYKNDLMLACATNNHQDWNYYELVGGFSTMTGAGDLAGDVLYLYHLPNNYYFGFQIGVGANNKNCENGLSGWFTYEGFSNNEHISGHGDVNVDVACEPSLDQDCIHNTSFSYFYRAVDGCGRATIASQQIVVEDTTAPVFSNCPESFTMECSDAVPAAATDLIALDNCTGDVTIQYLGEVAEGGPCYSTITRSWSATDICGNRSNCVQVITIVDTTAPVMGNLPAGEITVECDAVPAAAGVSIVDNCDENPTLVYNEERNDGNCPSNYTLIRTWYGYDQCQNYTETYTQTIHVQDTTAPTFDPYEFYAHIECDQIPAIIPASDNCGQATVVVIEETLNSGGCLGVLHRVYRATDECGNSAETEQYISILDTTAPVFVGLPENNTLECSEVILNNDGGVTGSDNCEHEVVITYSEQYVGQDDDCPETYEIIRTWVATDYCDNVATATRTTQVQDTTAPEFVSFPQDMTISCSDAIPPVEYPVAVDNCDSEVDVAFGEAIMPGSCPQNYTIHRTFRAYDNCQNETVETQVITVIDETAPSFDEQNNSYTYECNTDIPVIEPIAHDNCGEVSLSFVDSDSEGSSCYYTISRVWTAVDECNNASEFTQYIHIQDTTAPVISGVAQLDRPCDDYAGIYVNVSDNCNEYSVDYTDEMVSGSCAGNVIRHYIATDVCGNVSAEFVQVIHLTDEVAPVIAFVSPDMVVECGDEYGVQPASFTDNCDQELDITSNFSSSTDGCTTTETYTWTATDHCGNATTATTVVTIVDTTNPYFTALPENATVNCDETIPGFGEYAAADNCDSEVEVMVEESIIPGNCPQSYTIERVYRAADNCGNQVVESRYVYVIDQYAPVFEEQQSAYTYECGDAIPVIEPVAQDNCDLELDYNYSDIAEEGSSCDRYITRQWTAADDCGNVGTFYQTIRILDTQAPVVNPYTMAIDMPCDAVSNNIMISAEDCNEVVITYTDEYVSGGCAGKIMRTYAVSDVCGNQTTGLIQQIITLIDVTAPAVTSAPADVVIECGEEAPAYSPTWIDNCDQELSLSDSSSITSDACTSVIYQSWTASDACGNSTTVSRTITIVDSSAPVFTSVPQNENRECTQQDVVAPAYAIDNCSDVTITHSDVVTGGQCAANYTIERTYRATDECGNYAEYTQTINVSDNYGPIWGENNSQFVYECGSDASVVAPSASDACSVFTMDYTQGETWVEGCNSGFTRTWIAVDACGNASAPFVQYISFEDTTEPMLSGCPQNVVLGCTDAIPAPADVTAYDSCDDSVQVYFEEHIMGDVPAEGSIADCNLSTPARSVGNPCGYPYDWAMAMFAMPTAHRWYQVVDGHLVQYPGGSLHLVAQLENVLNPGSGFNVDVTFGNGMDWATWSSQGIPTSFKADCGANGANFASWTYFLLQAGPGAELTGYGAYEGSLINLVHAPANNYFGFQLGDGANNYNSAENGFGGWFSYSGVFRANQNLDLSSVSGAGDFAFELDCCPDYTIERQWTAIDCSGNAVTCTQTISFDGSASTGNGDNTTIASEGLESSKLTSEMAVSPNPANNNAVFTFKAAYAAKTSLEVLDMTGKKVADLFMGTVEAGASYNVNFNVSDLATGVYTYRLINGTDVKIDRLIINK